MAARGLGSLAGAAHKQGKYRTAEWRFKRALAIAERAFGPNDPEVATLLNNLGVLHKSQGRFADATIVYRRALRILRTTLA
jgi:Tfp pilus assembly protein PilF